MVETERESTARESATEDSTLQTKQALLVPQGTHAIDYASNEQGKTNPMNRKIFPFDKAVSFKNLFDASWAELRRLSTCIKIIPSRSFADLL